MDNADSVSKAERAKEDFDDDGSGGCGETSDGEDAEAD